MHPFIEKYLTGFDLNNSFMSDYESDNVVIETIRTLGSIRHLNGEEVNIILKQASQIDLEKSPCKDITILFLVYLSHAYYTNVFQDNDFTEKNKLEAMRTIDHALDLLSDDVHYTIKANVYIMHGSIYTLSPGMVEDDMYSKATDVLKFNHLRDIFLNALIIRMHSRLGKLKFYEGLNKLDGIYKKFNKTHVLLLNYFHDAVARGDTKKAKETLELYPFETESESINYYYYQDVLAHYYMQNDIWDTAQWDLVKPELRNTSSVQYYRAFQQNNPQKALEISKQIVKETNYISSADALILNAELSVGNIKAGQMIYERYKDFIKLKYVNHFYLMRIELLKKNYKKAASHYSQLLQGCQKYNSHGAFEYDLKISAEIDSNDFFRMTYYQQTEPLNSDFEIKEKSSTSREKSLLIGNSISTQRIKEQIHKYANLPIPILITGETGVGKEVVAKELHQTSERKEHKFLAINCGAINHTLLQSELFGHVEGAFTGAVKDKKGVFEMTGEGTVLLDEFGEAPELVQIALLRVLQEKEIRPVGSAETKSINCRILFATNANLESLVDAGKFRKDLYYRINHLILNIPPLRERTTDILTLAHHFLSQGHDQGNKIKLSNDLKEAMLDHPWPGNVRELKNEMELMKLLNSGKSDYNLSDFTKNKSEPKIEKITLLTQKEKDLLALKQFSQNHTSADRRLQRIKDIFQSCDRVYRTQLSKLLEVAPKTITSDFKKLLEEGFITRIEPSASPRSHYFIINDNSI